MKINSRAADDGNKTPQGQCLLCYIGNSYSVSHCVDCSFPLPWARAEIHEREPFGICNKCQAQNAYSTLNCWSCGAFLPWAYALTTLGESHISANQVSVMPSASPSKQTMPWTTSSISDNTLMAIDGRSQFVDVISFLCPPLGFVAYVSLLTRLPKQAFSAAKFAFYGLCLWFPVLLIVFVCSR